MTDPVALRIQQLPQKDQVLVFGRLAQDRDESRAFRPRDVAALFRDFGIPEPSNLARTVRDLKQDRKLTTVDRGQYRLSPLGRQASLELVDGSDVTALSAESVTGLGAEFGQAHNVVLPHYLAPPELLGPLRRFLADNPFDTNVFGMTRFPDADETDDDPDPVDGALRVTRTALRSHGLTFHLASEGALHDDLWTNVAGYMWACRYGVAFFEDRRHRGMNYNLNIECGAMLMAGRRCALLKDESVGSLPTDFVGRIYKPVDISDPEDVSTQVHRWVRDDLRLNACQDCPEDD